MLLTLASHDNCTKQFNMYLYCQLPGSGDTICYSPLQLSFNLSKDYWYFLLYLSVVRPYPYLYICPTAVKSQYLIIHCIERTYIIHSEISTHISSPDRIVIIGIISPDKSNSRYQIFNYDRSRHLSCTVILHVLVLLATRVSSPYLLILITAI